MHFNVTVRAVQPGESMEKAGSQSGKLIRQWDQTQQSGEHHKLQTSQSE